MTYYKLLIQLFFCGLFYLASGSFSLGQGIWTKKANACKAIYSTGFSIGSKGYFATGIDSLGNSTGVFWEWDQASDVWTQKADFSGTSRRGAVSFSIGNYGYMGTGYDGVTPPHGYTRDFWQYDPASNTWTQKADFAGTPRELAIGFAINNKGYIGTGYDGITTPEGVTNDFWQWDENMNAWTQIAAFPGKARYMAVGFSIGNKGYVGTGTDTANSFMRDFWEWNQLSNSWTQKATYGGTGRYGACAFSDGLKGYIGTGLDAHQTVTGFKNDFWRWDPATNKWTQQPALPSSARINSFSFSIGTRGYVGAGQYNYLTQTFYRDFWEYDPNETGIDDINLETLIFIYPNPTFGRIKIQCDNCRIENVEVFNSSGVKVYTSDGIRASHDLTSQADGIYFLKIVCSEGSVVKKLLIVK